MGNVRGLRRIAGRWPLLRARQDRMGKQDASQARLEQRVNGFVLDRKRSRCSTRPSQYHPAVSILVCGSGSRETRSRYSASRCRQRPSSRNARSSSFPYTVAGVVRKAACTNETPMPTQNSIGHPNPHRRGFLKLCCRAIVAIEHGIVRKEIPSPQLPCTDWFVFCNFPCSYPSVSTSLRT